MAAPPSPLRCSRPQQPAGTKAGGSSHLPFIFNPIPAGCRGQTAVVTPLKSTAKLLGEQEKSFHQNNYFKGSISLGSWIKSRNQEQQIPLKTMDSTCLWLILRNFFTFTHLLRQQGGSAIQSASNPCMRDFYCPFSSPLCFFVTVVARIR